MARQWLALKFFVSSTFLDLEQERDRLDGVFRRVRADVVDRQLTLLPYDLRWRTVDANGSYVDACLAWLRRCQYFISILDSRYGTRPAVGEDHSPNTERISITEMEIREALELDLPRVFFLRHPDHLRSADEVGETAEDGESLRALKQRPTDSGERVITYHDIDDLLEQAEAFLRETVDRDYPADRIVEAPEASAAEARAEFIRDLSSGFVGRSADLDRLRAHATARDDQRLLVVKAVAGTGKSALLAHFATHAPADVPVVSHWFGAGADEQTVAGVASSLAVQLQAAGLVEELPADPAALPALVADVLRETDRPLLVLLDAVDEVSEAGQDLHWLPAALGPNVRMIASTRPVEVADRLAARPRVRAVDLAPLDDPAIDAIIQQFVDEHSKPGAPILSDRDRLALRERAAGNPLFLKVALDELRAGGADVGHLATTVDGLFQQIVGRLEQRHGRSRVRDLLGCVAASRGGLTDTELADLLGGETAASVPRGEIALLLAELRNFIVNRQGTWTFFHGEFGRSVRQLLGVGGMREYHQRLVGYFADRAAADPRRLFELPWQATRAADWPVMLNLLSDGAFLDTKARAGMAADVAADYRHALHDAVVPLPDDAAVSVTTDAGAVRVDRVTLERISEAIHRDLGFLVRVPDRVLQTLGNACRWYDADAAAHHIAEPGGGWPTPPPWQQPEGERRHLHRLAEQWLKASTTPTIVSLRPPDPPLGSNLRLVLRAHGSDVNGASFSPDGRQIVSAGIEGIVRVHDASTGQELARMTGHEGAVYHPVFSPDGRRVASASIDHTVRIWDAATGECLHTLAGHAEAVDNALFSPDGSLIASGSHDATIILREASNGNEVRRLSGHTRNVTRVAFSADGSRLVSASEDKSAQVYDVATGEVIRRLEHDAPVSCVAFDPAAQQVVTAAWDGAIRVWSLETSEVVTQLRGHDRDAHTAVFSGNGRLIASAAFNELRLWDAGTGRLVMHVPAIGFTIHSVAFSPDSRRVVCAADDGSVRVWDVGEGAVNLQLVGHSAQVTGLAFSPTGDRFASASWDQTARIWTREGELVHVLAGHDGGLRSVTFSPDGTMLATACWDHTIGLWDATTGEPLRGLSGHEDAVNNVVFNADGTRVASAGFDRTVRIWDVATGDQVEAREHADAMKMDAAALYHAAGFGDLPPTNPTIRQAIGDGMTTFTDTAANATVQWPVPYDHLAMAPGSDGARVAAATEGGAVTVLEVRTC